jgi:two-component system sensor histidine kinase RegB
MISEQIGRCKAALSVISASAGELRADAGEALPVNTYLQDLIRQWKTEQPTIALQQHIDGTQPAPRLIADIALGQAITNILNNAAEASPEWVAIHADWTPQSLTLEIRDHGPGFSPKALTHIGKVPFSEKENGMGMGLLLAHSVIDRLGGQLIFDNEQQGACVRISLPLLPAATTEYSS